MATGGDYDSTEDISGLANPLTGLSVMTPATKDPFSRPGVTKDYSLHCFPRVEYKPVSEMQSMLEEETLSDCEMDILDWSFTHGGNKDLFFPSTFNFLRGSKGVDPRCYAYGGKRTPSAGNLAVKPPLVYVREVTLASGVAGSVPIHSDVLLNNFLSAHTNSPEDGLLLGEFYPKDLEVSCLHEKNHSNGS